MREEIFGPILPLLPFDTLEEAISFVQDRPRSLALYLFTKSRSVEREVLARIPFGGGCVNDTVVHLSTPYLPFGGVGASGMGSYHDRASFETFSHTKSILDKGGWPTCPFDTGRTPPGRRSCCGNFSFEKNFSSEEGNSPCFAYMVYVES